MTTSRRSSYDTITDATLSALTHFSTDDRKRLALALLDQLDVPPAAVESIAILLGVIYRDGDVLNCWACARLGTIERTDQPPGFGAIACDRCDEQERESWAKARSLSRFEDACDALRDDRKEQRCPVIRDGAATGLERRA